jgi:hypothetical protein
VSLSNLDSGTLYYYSIGIYNENDSISSGNDMFKTSGLRKSFIPNYEELIQPVGNEHIGATLNYNYDYKDENVYGVRSELFLLEDMASIFIIISILLVLALIYKKQKEKNKRKKKKWKKLDK